MRKLEAVENDTVVTARKEVERVDRELVKWRKKLAEVQGELGVAKKGEKELADRRAPLVVRAKAERDEKAQIELDRLTGKSFKVVQECGDLQLAVSQINEKVLRLETENETAVRGVRMEELKSLGRRRLTLAEEIEASIETAVASIQDHLKVGQEMLGVASILGYDKFGGDRRISGQFNLLDYIGNKLRFLGQLGTPHAQNRGPLTQMEQESLNGIFNEKTGRAA